MKRRRETPIHPKQWTLVIASREWSEAEKDSILAALAVEMSLISDFAPDYPPFFSLSLVFAL